MGWVAGIVGGKEGVGSWCLCDMRLLPRSRRSRHTGRKERRRRRRACCGLLAPSGTGDPSPCSGTCLSSCKARQGMSRRSNRSRVLRDRRVGCWAVRTAQAQATVHTAASKQGCCTGGGLTNRCSRPVSLVPRMRHGV